MPIAENFSLNRAQRALAVFLCGPLELRLKLERDVALENAISEFVPSTLHGHRGRELDSAKAALVLADGESLTKVICAALRLGAVEHVGELVARDPALAAVLVKHIDSIAAGRRPVPRPREVEQLLQQGIETPFHALHQVSQICRAAAARTAAMNLLKSF